MANLIILATFMPNKQNHFKHVSLIDLEEVSRIVRESEIHVMFRVQDSKIDVDD